jgi:hypothetical protein
MPSFDFCKLLLRLIPLSKSKVSLLVNIEVEGVLPDLVDSVSLVNSWSWLHWGMRYSSSVAPLRTSKKPWTWTPRQGVLAPELGLLPG